jgi:hypothetical protein
VVEEDPELEYTELLEYAGLEEAESGDTVVEEDSELE